jgi:ribosomal protein L40E
MTTVFKKQMLLIGPKEKVMEVFISYFGNHNYKITQSGVPDWVRFKKTVRWSDATKDDIGRTHFLTVELDKITENRTNAVFQFETDWAIGRGDWNTRSVLEAENLLTHLHGLLALRFEEPKTQILQPTQPTEREKVVEREVVVKIKCRYCGALNDQMAHKCVSCGGPM